MPSSVEAAAIALLVIAPGLLFELGIERTHAYWRTGLADRVLRFFAWSVMFHSLAFPLTIWIRSRLSDDDWQQYGDHTWPLWVAAVSYVFGPLCLGFVLSGRVQAVFIGKDLPPTAWDHLWSTGQEGYVRVRYRDSENWTAGVWKYSSSYPSVTDDLLLDPVIVCDRENGRLTMGEDGNPIDTHWSALIRREDVEWIEFQPFPAKGEHP